MNKYMMPHSPSASQLHLEHQCLNMKLNTISIGRAELAHSKMAA